MVLGVLGTVVFAASAIALALGSGWWRLLAVVPAGLVVVFGYGVHASWRRTYRDEYGVARTSADETPEDQAPGEPMGEVALREVEDADHDALFEQQRDPEAVRMAAFTARDPDDREAFDEHLGRVLANPEITHRAITLDGRLVGSVAIFVLDGRTEITYWVDRAVWGQGIASQAVAQLLGIVATRPVYARAASDNAGSLRVLAKAGFVVVGTETGYAAGRDAEIEETILRLD